MSILREIRKAKANLYILMGLLMKVKLETIIYMEKVSGRRRLYHKVKQRNVIISFLPL